MHKYPWTGGLLLVTAALIGVISFSADPIFINNNNLALSPSGDALSLIAQISNTKLGKMFTGKSVDSITETKKVLTPSNYDVVIVGAGTGGSAAAITAARLGAKVALIEETDWVGGQMTAAGVSTMDVWQIYSGIYKEFLDRTKQYYLNRGKPIETCSGGKCFEVAVGQKILREMFDETRKSGKILDLYERTKITGVIKNGNIITGITTADGKTFNAKVVVDATEYGDLLPLAGIPYRIGNGTNENPNPAACVQDITYTAVIKKYPQGVPSELKLNTPPPGYNAEIVKNFAAVVTKNGNPVLFTGTPYNFAAHNVYRHVPDSTNPDNYTGNDPSRITKTGVNYMNDYPAETAGVVYTASTTKLSVRYIEDPIFRKATNCEAKLKTLQFLYYMQHDLGETLWSVANDEGYNTPYNITDNSCSNIPQEFKAIEQNMPVMPYVRESRRMIGIQTVTAKDIKRTGTPAIGAVAFPSSIAVGDYGNDLHNCSADNTLELSLESRADITGAGLFQIPIEALIPATMDGFLAAEKNISQTRLTSGATRLQPITMMTGQAVGTLAAMAVQKNIQPRMVKTEDVQKTLLQNQAAISEFNYSDMPAFGSAKWQAIQLLSARGLMVGYGSGLFGINDNLTRAQAATVIARRFNLNTNITTSSFADVAPGSQGAGAIEAIYRAGITAGCGSSPRRFCPNSPITRGQLVVFLARGLGADSSATSPAPYFTDVPATHSFFKFVQFSYEKGLTAGCSTNPAKFCPDLNISRSDAALMFAATLGK